MRYAILLALLMCLPVRGEAWQVVGGGETVTSLILYDDFVETANTNLIDHTPEIGGVWTTYSSGGTYITVNPTAAVISSAASVSAVSNSGPMTSGTIAVEGLTITASATRYYKACVWDTGSMSANANGYCASINGLGGLVLARYTNLGSEAVLASETCSGYYAVDTKYRVSLIVDGNNYSAKLLDGETEVCSTAVFSDASFSGAKYPGLRAASTNVRLLEIRAESND